MHTKMFAFANLVKKLSHSAFCVWALPGLAHAHVSEMGLVLLLPTGFYIQAGVWAVALTVIALAFIPGKWAERLTSARTLFGAPAASGLWGISCVSAVFLIVLLWAGFNGSRDPLVNPLPLMVWTVVWIALLLAQAVFGDLWRFVNPWSGPVRVLTGGSPPPFRLPDRAARWVGCSGLLAFACFALADPAPDDPARLAMFTSLYWLAVLLACLLWGTEPVLTRCEFLSMTARRFAAMAPMRPKDGSWRLGLPGWGLIQTDASTSTGIFALLILGIGSFDGLNETFWWLGQIGVNPLEFPGRSALVGITVAGTLGACAVLIAAFTLTLWLGLKCAPGVPLSRAFGPMAVSVLPIGVAYHFAHYLTTLMVSGQYAIAAVSDPLATGADLLGLGRYYVSTSFFNTPSSVELIFKAQAGAVVAGHVISVLVAHGIATRLYGHGRRAAVSQIPLAIFMVAYTFLGLWLLASPKGA